MKKLIKFWPYLFILAIGFALRLIWNPHQIIWSYDQARDAYFMREMIENKDLILLGPQTESYGLFHGPLYYYLFAPLYSFSKGETFLPLVAMSILNLFSAIPLALIAVKVTKNKLAGIFTFAVFCFSYAFVEYSRWLSNVSITLPFVAWAYYLLYRIVEGKTKRIKLILFLLGLSIGLAIQGEIFLLSLAVVFFIVLITKKIKLAGLINYALGVGVGMLPILIAQIKFNFLGTKIFTEIVTGGFLNSPQGIWAKIVGYLNHIGMTFYQTIGGGSVMVGVILFVLILMLTVKRINKLWLIAVLGAHAILFFFNYIDVVFLDIGLALLLPVMVGVGGYFLFKSNRYMFSAVIILFLVFQIGLFKSYLIGRNPFNGYRFIHPGASTLIDLDEIAAKMYEISEQKEFTISVIGTPFGVRTVWASVFELYARNNNVPVPKWLEYYAEGYPGDKILEPVKKPAPVHFLIMESNIKNLLPNPIIVRELGNQDNNTVKVSEFVLNNTTVQVRRPTKK